MKKLNLSLIVAIFLFGHLFAQNEFIVNTYVDSTQRDPQIGKDNQGNYLVVWDSENQLSGNSQSDIFMQKFNPDDEKVGTETLVNEFTQGEQEKPATAMNGAGDFIIAWASHTGESASIFDIKAKIYKASGVSTGEFLVNTHTDHSQTNPEVAVSGDGKFLVVWESWDQDGSDRGVYGQLFDADGNKIGGEVGINTTTLYSQARPAAKFFGDGKFIVLWESWNQDATNPSGYGIYGKIFGPDFSTVVDEFPINTYTKDYQWFGNLEVFGDNSFIAVWCSWEQDGGDGGIYMQKFDASANKVGVETLVNRTTTFYQWLPQIKDAGDGNFVVVWSSWQQDGSREGVYAQLFDSQMNKISFQTQVNLTTEGYQWEPVFISKGGNELLVVYSGWDPSTDFEIVGRKIDLIDPQGSILPNTYGHTGGNSTTRMHVYVVDSTALTGNDYEVSFVNNSGNNLLASVKNSTTGSQITSFPIYEVQGGIYLSEIFDGVSVEIIPEFEFELDTGLSYFLNNSGTNISFQAVGATGTIHLAPIDVLLVWGSPDTTSSGNYTNPLSYAYSQMGVKEVECPFLGWNATDNESIELFVIESTGMINKRWDPGERITFLTPLQYNPTFPRFHAAVTSTPPGGSIIMPNAGDTNFVYTKRPLTTEDVYTFQTSPSLVTGKEDASFSPGVFRLDQNYPNPFNPSTTIYFSLPAEGSVNLSVFNVLGQRVSTLFDGTLKTGTHRFEFNGGSLSSGVYFYALKYENKLLVKKMMLLK